MFYANFTIHGFRCNKLCNRKLLDNELKNAILLYLLFIVEHNVVVEIFTKEKTLCTYL